MKQGTGNYVYRRLALALALMSPAAVLAATQAGFVLVASGGVTAVGADGASRELSRRSPVYAGDRLVTAAGARAQVKFTDGAIVGLKPKSELRIEDYRFEPDGAQASVLALIKGGFRTVTGAIGKASKTDYKITTPVATIGIRGTLYDADYVPGEGLDLAVWDGGISACNSGGCLDLGADTDYRYGHIAEDGTREGRNEPEVDEEEDDPVFGQLESDLTDEDMTLFLSDSKRAAYPLTGYAVVSGAQSNPWGTARVLTLEYGRFSVEASAYGGGLDQVNDFAFQSSTAGDKFINDGYDCGIESCSFYFAGGNPQHGALGARSGSEVFWGYWNGYDVSVGSQDNVVTTDLISNSGVFALGTWASPAVIATLTGTVSFSPYQTLIVDSGGTPGSTSASGDISVHMDTGLASGALQFADFNSDTWSLQFSGTVSAAGLALDVVTNSVAPTSGSYFTAFGGSAGQEIAVTGTVQASFVGTSAVDGIVGAFDVKTADGDAAALPAVPPTDTVNGVFIMAAIPVIIITGQ